MGFKDWITGLFTKEEEEVSYQTAACGRCGIEYPEDVMNVEGSMMFCNQCMDKKRLEEEDLERKRRLMSRTAILHFKCADCRFSFKRREEFKIRMCPNCGGVNFFAEGRSYK
ncbi:TPA: hypothetical protein HA265_04975 [Candidatus Woesearchaeota archaeon]|nr:hypothetical protein [Candidatus Woesearchaeota archaeon]